MQTSLIQIYRKLLSLHGPQGWWPIKGEYKAREELNEEDCVEICVGAILTQNTSWKNAAKALEKLRAQKLLSLKRIANIEEKKLSKLIQNSGYFNQKTKKLKIFCKYVLEKYGTLAKLFEQPNAREELLSLWGIGPETADSMLLYAGQKPVFVIDAYTKRIMARLGFCKADVSYNELQGLFHKNLPREHKLFNEYHALLVEHAKCNAKKAHLRTQCY